MAMVNVYASLIARRVKRTTQVLATRRRENRAFTIARELDLNEQKRLTQERERALRLIFDASPEPIGLSTVDDGTFVEVTNLLGYTREEAYGSSALKLGIWVDEQERKEFVRRIQEDGVVHNLEVKLRNKQDVIVPVLMSGTLVNLDGTSYIVAFPREITEIKRTQQELIAAREQLTSQVAALHDSQNSLRIQILERQQAETKFRALLESAPDAMIIVDGQGTITLINAQAERMFGYSRDELIGRSVETLMPIAYRDRHLSYRREFLRAPTMRTIGSGFDIYGLRRDAGEFPIEISLSPIETEREILVCAAVRDLTERKQIEKALREATEIASVERLRAEFVARISHELRTPLNAIIGTTELQMLSDLTAEQRRDIDIIQSSSEVLLNTVNDLLEMSRLSAGKPALETIDFNFLHLIEGIVDSLAIIARKKNLELTLYLDPTIPIGLRGDPHKLRQVLNNLLSNGIKFTEDGDIFIHVSKLDDTDEAVALRFAIQDSGIGIAPEVQSRLFKPFVQADVSTHRRYGGTGLGLAISAQLVEQMGGRIEIESELHKGSTFSFAIRLEKGMHIPSVWALNPIIPRTPAIRALVTDDNAIARQVITDYLTTWGLSIRAVNSGMAALDELRRGNHQNRPYQLILVDEGMPGFGGSTIARMIRQDPCFLQTKIILMTSMEQDGSDQIVDGCITKPVRSARLFNAVHELFAESYPVAETKSPIADSIHELDWRHGVSILVIEDHATNQVVVQQQLRALGYQSKIVSDAKQGLEELFAATYNAVLLDCELPEMDGYTAVREIRRREGSERHTVVIALTAHATESERNKCLDAGMDDFLSKPVKLQILAEMIDKWTRGNRSSVICQ